MGGIALGLGAYLIWGLLPIYLHQLSGVPPGEVLAHRIAWSLATAALLLVALRRTSWIGAALREPRALGRYGATAALVSVNWLLYIWSVQNGHVIDASLGYFINPLVTLALGRIFLHERLRPLQLLPLALVVAGVGWLTWQSGGVPWIGLALATSFALYGLLRKTARLGPIEGFSVEAALLFPFALGYFAWAHEGGGTAFAAGDGSLRLLLVLAGPLTTVPLVLFAAAARRVPLSTVGLLQYVAPTLQWLTGALLFHEEFSSAKAVGFGIIWVALALYALEGVATGWARSRGR